MDGWDLAMVYVGYLHCIWSNQSQDRKPIKTTNLPYRDSDCILKFRHINIRPFQTFSLQKIRVVNVIVSRTCTENAA